MATIPQLRKDISELQDKIRKLETDLVDARSKPVEVREVVKRIPYPVEKIVTKFVEKPYPVTKVIHRDVPGPIRYKDNPKHIAMIRKLQNANKF